MGTTFREGDKPKNNVTVGRGGKPPTFDAETGERKEVKAADRSFAQPNPAVPHEDPKPKSHGSKQEEEDAIRRNSTLRRGQGDDEQPES